MTRQEQFSYKLSKLPPNLYLSPAFLFAWWDKVIERSGAQAALKDHSPDFKLGRELWVAAIFACCKRIQNDKEHWVKPVDDVAPDAIVAYMKRDALGFGQLMYPIEVTTYGSDSRNIENVLKSKLDKSYTGVTRIICYITGADNSGVVDSRKLIKFVAENNPREYEVWLLGSLDSPIGSKVLPMRLVCLSADEIYDFSYTEQKHIANSAEAFKMADGLSTNRKGTIEPLGQITLQFPEVA